MDTGQKTESLAQLVEDIAKEAVALPEFQRDFVWDVEKTFDLFDSFVRDIFVGSLIYGIPSFEVTVRELDHRPRTGKGSRARLKLTSFTKPEIEKRVKVHGFRLLLDGQQRATSIYRALSGVDEVYLVTLLESELSSEVRSLPVSKRSIEQVLGEFRGEPLDGHVNIGMHDVYRILRGDFPREKDKIEPFLKSNRISGVVAENAEDSNEFITYLTQVRNIENLLRQEKLIAYYLLDTDEEKFALFFERSNSKGIQLNFIDILAAKLYAGFNLREKIKEFEDENPSIPLNREAIVRSISFRVSDGKDMGRGYILSTLNQSHFNLHWDRFTEAYKRSYDYLITTKLLIHSTWIPYENMLIPLVAFITQFHHLDFSQIGAAQAKMIEAWYWLAVLSRRYSSAAQTYALEDAQALQKAANGDESAIKSIVLKMRPVIRSKDDLFAIHKKYDAVYKGILNLISFHTGGFLNLENGNPASMSSNLEDHHIFPKDYLSKNWERVHDSLDSEISIECVVNRTLIPKLTNIKVGNKPPSKYLGELRNKNPEIQKALASHLISSDLLNGSYDEMYDYFLDERAEWIMRVVQSRVIDLQQELAGDPGEV